MNKSSSFFWSLLNLCWIKNDIDSGKKLISTINNNLIDVPLQLENLISEFEFGDTETALKKIFLACAKSHCFEQDKHIILIGLLVGRNVLDMRSAALMMSGQNNYPAGSNDSMKKFIDVCWLINQDMKDGIMDVNHDNLFEVSLRNMVSSVEQVGWGKHAHPNTSDC